MAGMGGRPWIVTGSRARLARETTGWTRRSRALAEPRRRAILQLVAHSELSVTRSVGCFDVRVTDQQASCCVIGRFADAQEDGAMGIFTTRGAAEEFVGGDPFVLHGVVRNRTVRNWNEARRPPEQRSFRPLGDPEATG